MRHDINEQVLGNKHYKNDIYQLSPINATCIPRQTLVHLSLKYLKMVLQAPRNNSFPFAATRIWMKGKCSAIP